MSGPGLIALDPLRMQDLEGYLHGLGDGCRQRAAAVDDLVASTGAPVSVAAEVAELGRLSAAWYEVCADVARRRRLVEQMPEDLPLTSWAHFPAPLSAAAVDALAARVTRAIEARPPTWEAIEASLSDLARIAGSDPLAARFLVRFTARRTRDLHALLERFVAERRGEGASALRAQAMSTELATMVRDASRHDGPHSLAVGWFDTYLGTPPGAGSADVADDHARSVARQVKEQLTLAGYGLFAADKVALLVGAQVARGALGPVAAAVNVAKAPLTLLDGDGLECDVPEAGLNATSGGLALASVVASGGTAAIPLAVAAAAVAGLGFLFGACKHQDGKAAQRHFNEGTGTWTYSGGSEWNYWSGPTGHPKGNNVIPSG